jgi:hypothetical protein
MLFGLVRHGGGMFAQQGSAPGKATDVLKYAGAPQFPAASILTGRQGVIFL